MFTITKVVVALMVATAVAAAPNKRQFFDDITCTFVMTPDATVAPGSIDLDEEFNFGEYQYSRRSGDPCNSHFCPVIGRTLAEQVPDTSVEVRSPFTYLVVWSSDVSLASLM